MKIHDVILLIIINQRDSNFLKHEIHFFHHGRLGTKVINAHSRPNHLPRTLNLSTLVLCIHDIAPYIISTLHIVSNQNRS